MVIKRYFVKEMWHDGGRVGLVGADYFQRSNLYAICFGVTGMYHLQLCNGYTRTYTPRIGRTSKLHGFLGVFSWHSTIL